MFSKCLASPPKITCSEFFLLCNNPPNYQEEASSPLAPWSFQIGGYLGPSPRSKGRPSIALEDNSITWFGCDWIERQGGRDQLGTGNGTVSFTLQWARQSSLDSVILSWPIFICLPRRTWHSAVLAHRGWAAMQVNALPPRVVLGFMIKTLCDGFVPPSTWCLQSLHQSVTWGFPPGQSQVNMRNSFSLVAMTLQANVPFGTPEMNW